MVTKKKKKKKKKKRCVLLYLPTFEHSRECTVFHFSIYRHSRQRRSSADPLTDQVTEQKRTTTIVPGHEKPKRHPTRAQANTCRRAEQPQWNTDDGDEDEDDQLCSWTLVAGKKPTGKKAVIYVGNLKIGAKDNEVTEYIKWRCEKLCIRLPTIHNCKIFEKDAEEGEIVEFCGSPPANFGFRKKC